MPTVEQFRSALAQRGIIADNIIADGQLHCADVDVENGRHDAAVMNAPATGFPPGPVETDITDESYIVRQR